MAKTHFFKVKRSTRPSTKLREQRLCTITGTGDISLYMVLWACQFLRSVGALPCKVIISHADKDILEYFRREIIKVVGYKRVVVVGTGVAYRGNGKRLSSALRNKPKYMAQVGELRGKIQSDVVKHGSDCLISFRSMGASSGLMSDDIFNAIEKLFTYKICAFTEPTKGSILSPKNMPEILSNALNYDDNTRCFLLRNYEKIQEIDLANVALICAVALGTNHPVLEGLDTSDWFSLLTKFTDVLAVANSNPHENIWRPCFPFLARVPNKDTTVQSARDALCKLDTCREDIVLLVGDAHPALVTQVENEAFANGAVKPLAYQQFIAGIKDENANIFAGRFRSLDILKTPIPNFDKSREMG